MTRKLIISSVTFDKKSNVEPSLVIKFLTSLSVYANSGIYTTNGLIKY